MALILSIFTALWIGILTSISPCPLATNIAAISFVSYRVAHKGIVLLSGFLYTLGRCITYAVIGFLVVKIMINIPLVSDFLQRYINKILGVLLIIVGIFLLGFLKINLPSAAISQKWQKKLNEIGILGSLFLGILFALAFCPISAALFFGSLIPIAIKTKSSIALPLVYGVGTALPVLGFALLIAVGSKYIDIIYKKTARIESITQKITGIIFVLVGIYYVLSYVFQII